MPMFIIMSETPIPSSEHADPLRIAWRNFGQSWKSTADKNLIGSCGRCQNLERLTAFKDIISHNFTGWGAVDPSALGLCDPCAWGYRDPMMRIMPTIIHRDGRAIIATQEQLRFILSMSFPPDVAVSVPYSGSKHILPSAQWGMVVSDDGPLSWRSTEAGLTDIVSALRTLNINESELMEPAPPAEAVFTLSTDTDKMIELLDLWAKLRVWQKGPHLRIAIAGTHG
jgi:hypothetical protein